MSELLYKLNKTPEDVEYLLQQHHKLVYFMLSKVSQLGNHDAESAAWEALWDAINTFDIYASTAFSTYACTVIKNAINDVLRKEAVIKKHTCPFTAYTENTLVVYIPEQEDNTAVLFIEKLFQAYVTTKTGIVRDILLAWHSSGFTASVINIATMCSTSPSYVSRVQCAFRAYISGKIKR